VEALYLVCGARRPQLKRDPLGSRTTNRTVTAMAHRTQLSLVIIVISQLACAGGSAPRVLSPATSCATVSPNPADTTVYDSLTVTERPAMRFGGPMPTYPPDLQARRIQGRALFTVVISAAGLVEPDDVRATSAYPEFIEGARPTVLGSRFWPACRDGSQSDIGRSCLSPLPLLAYDRSSCRLPNQRLKLTARGGRLIGNGSLLIAAAAGRSLSAIR